MKQITIKGKRADDFLPIVNNLMVEFMAKLHANVQIEAIAFTFIKGRHA